MSAEETSARISRRSVLVGGALAMTAAGAYAATPRRAEHRLARQKLGDLVSRTIGPWQVTTPAGVIVATEEAVDTEGYDQLLTRVYQAAGLPTIMLLIAYGSTQGGSLQLHRPETCYPGQGFRLSQFDQKNFDFFGDGAVVQTRQFTAERDERIEHVLYWTRIARSFPLNTAGEYGAIFASVLRGYVPDGVLVRVSTILPNRGLADSALVRFARAMIATATPTGQQVLLGRDEPGAAAT